MKAIVGVLVVGSCLVILYLLAWPVPIEPLAWEAPTHAGYVGPFFPNDLLAGIEPIGIGSFTGPEDVVIDGEGRIYTGTYEGVIVRLDADGHNPHPWAQTGGRPLGLAFAPDGDLIVADAFKGLLRVSADGEISTLATAADGRSIRYANNVDVAADGSIYFSEASNKFGDPERAHYQASLLELMEHGGTGRVMRWDASSGRATTLLDDLSHANGVALTADDSALLINETGNYRVLRLQLNGAEAGQVEVIAENLPGFPDNLTRGREGRFWLGLVAPRNDLLDRLSSRAFVRKVVQRLPEALRPQAEPFSHVIAIDGRGRILKDLQDPAGRYPFCTAVAENDRYLYIASLKNATLGRIERVRVGL